MPAFPREELEEMMERWLEANRNAEREGDWSTYLGAHYTDDAVYRWNVGPNEEFWARGIEEIKEVALGYHMKGFEDWVYPYDTVLIDEKQGQVVGFWRQVAPFKRADGTDYEVAGVGGTWFKYAGDFKWSWQRDFFDFGNVKATFIELAGRGPLEPDDSSEDPSAGQDRVPISCLGTSRSVPSRASSTSSRIFGR